MALGAGTMFAVDSLCLTSVEFTFPGKTFSAFFTESLSLRMSLHCFTSAKTTAVMAAVSTKPSVVILLLGIPPRRNPLSLNHRT